MQKKLRKQKARLKKDLVTDRFVLDGAVLKKAFHRPSPPSGWYSFPQGDYRVLVPAEKDCLILASGEKPVAGIPVRWTPWAFGGSRPWYRCLRCDRSVLTVYWGRRGFLCRECEGLTYLSAQGARLDRLLVKATKARDRLGPWNRLNDSFPPRPKYRRKKKQARLKTKALEAIMSYQSAVAQWIGKQENLVREYPEYPRRRSGVSRKGEGAGRRSRTLPPRM